MKWIDEVIGQSWIQKMLDCLVYFIRKPKPKEMQKKQFVVAIPVYDGVDLMDIAAPREMFTWPKSDTLEMVVYFIGQEDSSGRFPAIPVSTRDGLKIIPDAAYGDKAIQSPNLIWVPGGAPDALSAIRSNPEDALLSYVRDKGQNADWVCSVCEGAILLASTGLLDGYWATTHHSFYPCMAAFPKVKMVEGYPRYVKDGNRITGGGISSGLDEALYIIELVMGTEAAISVQQVMQYYPEPPVSSKIVPSDCCPVEGMINNTCT